jgi:serine/threonine-protein kinase HipA
MRWRRGFFLVGEYLRPPCPRGSRKPEDSACYFGKSNRRRAENPLGEEPEPAGDVQGRPVTEEEIGRLLGNLAAAPLGVGEDEDFRISVAGAQEKTALLFREGGWYKPVGTAATTHILKPSIGRLPNGVDLTFSVENEFFCLKLLRALGVPAANAEMKNFGEVRTLVVERFDRLWDSR